MQHQILHQDLLPAAVLKWQLRIDLLEEVAHLRVVFYGDFDVLAVDCMNGRVDEVSHLW